MFHRRRWHLSHSGRLTPPSQWREPRTMARSLSTGRKAARVAPTAHGVNACGLRVSRDFESIATWSFIGHRGQWMHHIRRGIMRLSDNYVVALSNIAPVRYRSPKSARHPPWLDEGSILANVMYLHKNAELSLTILIAPPSKACSCHIKVVISMSLEGLNQSCVRGLSFEEIVNGESRIGLHEHHRKKSERCRTLNAGERK